MLEIQFEEVLCEMLNPELIGSDLQLSYLSDYYKNINYTAQLIRQVLLERYGRDFSKEDSLPELFRR